MLLLRVITIVLFVLSTRAGTIIMSDLIGEQMTGTGQITESQYPYPTRFPVPEAKWIWGPNWRSAPAGESRVFTEHFNLFCDSEITLHATTDNKFTAKINGVEVLSGDNWRTVFSVTLNNGDPILNTCGKNTLEITPTNYDHGSPAALIYAIVQDRSCLDCPDGSTYNFRNCECDCGERVENACSCQSEKQCSAGFYFDRQTCECEVIPTPCAPNKRWTKKLSACECKKRDRCLCVSFNEDTCECIMQE